MQYVRGVLLLFILALASSCYDTKNVEPTAQESPVSTERYVALESTSEFTSESTLADAASANDSGPALEPTPGEPSTAALPPAKPAGLVSYVTGEEKDAQVKPRGPGLILMGGSREVDAAFLWWKPLLAKGDVVILRASGSDGYNSYLYKDIGGVDSVVTLLVTSRELANSEHVVWHVERAEGIFLAGGDQSKYLRFWQGTRLGQALQKAWSRGAVIGGTSAGLAVLGDFVFSATNGTVTSQQALTNPYAPRVQLARQFLAYPPLQHIITDSHFARRDRMGRLVSFLARIVQDKWATSAVGLGVDERTALVVDPQGKGTVLGQGAVYVLKSNNSPQVCAPGKVLEWSNLTVHRLVQGDTVSLPSGKTSVAGKSLSAFAGQLQPKDPYR